MIDDKDQPDSPFRLTENIDQRYRDAMTSVDQRRSALASDESQVLIAGVPWPTYKVVALAVGLIVLVVVAAVTTTAAHAVLSGAASATLVWLVLGLARQRRR